MWVLAKLVVFAIIMSLAKCQDVATRPVRVYLQPPTVIVLSKMFFFYTYSRNCLKVQLTRWLKSLLISPRRLLRNNTSHVSISLIKKRKCRVIFKCCCKKTAKALSKETNKKWKRGNNHSNLQKKQIRRIYFEGREITGIKELYPSSVLAINVTFQRRATIYKVETLARM